MTKAKNPIDFTRYVERICLSLHECRICGSDIKLYERYYDGGHGRRAHVKCAGPKERKERKAP